MPGTARPLQMSLDLWASLVEAVTISGYIWCLRVGADSVTACNIHRRDNVNVPVHPAVWYSTRTSCRPDSAILSSAGLVGLAAGRTSRNDTSSHPCPVKTRVRQNFGRDAQSKHLLYRVRMACMTFSSSTISPSEINANGAESCGQTAQRLRALQTQTCTCDGYCWGCPNDVCDRRQELGHRWWLHVEP